MWIIVWFQQVVSCESSEQVCQRPNTLMKRLHIHIVIMSSFSHVICFWQPEPILLTYCSNSLPSSFPQPRDRQTLCHFQYLVISGFLSPFMFYIHIKQVDGKPHLWHVVCTFHGVMLLSQDWITLHAICGCAFITYSWPLVASCQISPLVSVSPVS